MEIEAVDIVEESPAPASTYPVVLERPSFPERPSPDETTVTTLGARRRRDQLRRVVVGCVSACAALLVMAALRAPAHATAAPTVAKAAEPAPAPPVRSAEAPKQDLAPWAEIPTHAAVQPASGAIEVAQGKVVALDGKRVSGRAAMVPCGRHQLRVGRGAARAVVVPCGGTLSVEPNGTISVY